MIIANPIYDVVFKRLMENNRVAKFFVSTMLDEKVISLDMKPQEFTYDDQLIGIRLFRLDFIAIIETAEGERKKIIIEIQKAKKEIDLMRFRNYLAEQYKKEDVIEDEKVVLPITTIYILGFKLSNIETACVKVKRQYRDLINETILEERNDFIEKLTHDSYVVQVERITGKYQSRLDKLLSVFEQNHFVDATETIKEFKHKAQDKDLKIMTAILHHSGTDPVSKKEIEKEQEAWRSIDALFRNKEKDFEKKLALSRAEIEKEREGREKEREEKEKEREEKEKEREEKEKEREEKEKYKRLFEELQNKIDSKEK